MKRFSKSFIILCSLILVLEVFSLSMIAFIPVARAADAPTTGDDIRELKLVVPIGDKSLGTISEKTATRIKADKTTETYKYVEIPWIANYIGNAYRYGVALGSILAVVMIMVGGIMYTVSGMNTSMVGRSRELISGAVTGLVLLLSSYVLLNTVNPNLIKMTPIQVETIKAQAIMTSDFCSELDLPDSTLEVDTSKQGTKGTAGAEWKTKPTCGEDFPVKLKAAEAAKGDSSAGNQTCKSDACPNPAEKCVDDFEGSPGWGCHNVLMYGRIKLPDIMELLSCNPKLIFGNNFYVEKVRVVAVSQHGFVPCVKASALDLTCTYWPVTEYKPVGADKASYSFAKSDLLSSFSGPDYDNWLVLIDFQINDASWLILPTIDKDVFAAPKNTSIGGKETDVALADTCWFRTDPNNILAGWDTKVFNVQYTGGKPLYIEAPKITIGELKAGTKTVKWNINISKDFFGCSKKGDATAVKGEITCKYATQGVAGTFDKKFGQPCSKPQDCGMGLWCMTHGPVGVFNTCGLLANKIGAECDTTDECGKVDCTCSGNGQSCAWGDQTSKESSCGFGQFGTCNCKTPLYCVGKTTLPPNPGKCTAAGIKHGDACDPTDNHTCANGLICDKDRNACAEAPPTCKKNSDCLAVPGYYKFVSGTPLAGECNKGYCNCNSDAECADNYHCAKNETGLYQGSNPCVITK